MVILVKIIGILRIISKNCNFRKKLLSVWDGFCVLELWSSFEEMLQESWEIIVVSETSIEVKLLKVLLFWVLDESSELLIILFEGVLEFLKFVFLLSLFNKKILLLKILSFYWKIFMVFIRNFNNFMYTINIVIWPCDFYFYLSA